MHSTLEAGEADPYGAPHAYATSGIGGSTAKTSSVTATSVLVLSEGHLPVFEQQFALTGDQ